MLLNHSAFLFCCFGSDSLFQRSCFICTQLFRFFHVLSFDLLLDFSSITFGMSCFACIVKPCTVIFWVWFPQLIFIIYFFQLYWLSSLLLLSFISCFISLCYFMFSFPYYFACPHSSYLFILFPIQHLFLFFNSYSFVTDYFAPA